VEDGDARTEIYSLGRQGESVHDERGPEVVGHRVADDLFGVAVQDGRQVQPSFPGPDLGDVADELGSWSVAGEVPGQQIRVLQASPATVVVGRQGRG